MSYLMPNKEEKVVSCMSRTLAKVEEKYYSWHKEALAINCAVFQFTQFLLDRKFFIKTNCRLLMGIFGQAF